MPQSETIWYISYTQILPKTEDRVMLFSSRPVLNTPLPHGELEEPLLVSQELLDLVLQEPDKVPSVTCVEKHVCLLHSKSGENGTERLMSPKEDMPSLPHSLHQLLLHSLWLEDIKFLTYQNSHLSLTTSTAQTPDLC
jgi:hypothetical protein